MLYFIRFYYNGPKHLKSAQKAMIVDFFWVQEGGTLRIP